MCLDPYVNGLHVSLLRRRRYTELSRDYLAEMRPALHQAKGRRRSNRARSTPSSMTLRRVTSLHYRLWSSSENELAPFWSLAIKQYNIAASSTPSLPTLLAQKGIQMAEAPMEK